MGAARQIGRKSFAPKIGMNTIPTRTPMSRPRPSPISERMLWSSDIRRRKELAGTRHGAQDSSNCPHEWFNRHLVHGRNARPARDGRGQRGPRPRAHWRLGAHDLRARAAAVGTRSLARFAAPPQRSTVLYESDSEARGGETGEAALRLGAGGQALCDSVQQLLADGGALDLPRAGNAAPADEGPRYADVYAGP